MADTTATTKAVNTEVVDNNGTGLTLEMSTSTASPVGAAREAQADVSVDTTQGDKAEPEKEAPEAEEEQPEKEAPEAGELPDYDPENEEVRAAYDKKYFDEGGKLNTKTISDEYWKSFRAAGDDVAKAGLPESTYAYLSDVLGLPKEAMKDIEAGLVAKHKGEVSSILSRVEGGVGRYNKAIAWATAGVYTDEQQAAYNDAMAAGGARRDDAIDALMARFDRATSRDHRRGPPNSRSRRSSPQRDVTGSSPSGRGAGGEVFASKGEYEKAIAEGRRALNEAKSAENRKAVADAERALEAIRAKGRRSPAFSNR